MLNLDLEHSTTDLYGLLSKNAGDPQMMEWLSSDINLLKAELYEAERRARKGGKRKTYNTHAVEAYLDDNIDRLAKQLYYKQYTPSPGVAHIIDNPVKREIFAAPYIDRIVHHWVVDTIYPWWDRRLSSGASSCRVGKGTAYGINLLDKHVRQASKNYAVPVWIVKLDISGYFMHIVRKKLLKKVLWGLDRQFEGNYGWRYQTLKHAITEIIMDNPIEGVKVRGSYKDWRELPTDKSLFAAEADCGLVIGNVSSQVFSNIYLDALDRYIRLTLGYRYSGRYVDDFYMVVVDEQLPQLKRDIEAIDKFLQSLGLKLNRKKTRYLRPWQGVPFLGIVNKSGVMMPDKRLTRNFRKSAKAYIDGIGDEDSVLSYLGMMKNYHSWQVIYKTFSRHEKMLDLLLEHF